jgi:Plavaka transposase
VPQYYPYPNWSSFELGDLLWSRGPIQSLERFNELIQLFRNPEFCLEDVRHADWASIHKQLACGTQPGLDTSAEWVDDVGPGWVTSKVTFTVPFPTRGTGSKTETYEAGVLHHRKIVSVIKEKFADPVEHLGRCFEAHSVFWQPDLSVDPVRVYGEVYTSDEFQKMEKEVRGLILDEEKDRGLERVVVALMFWTDATLLANFGVAELWPCYLFFGNDSKYLRAGSTSNLCNHIAYFDSVSFSFNVQREGCD